MRYLTTLGMLLRAVSLIVGNAFILIVLGLVIGEWWARSIAPPKPETKAITVLNQHAAYQPWSGYRNTPGFRYELGNWVPVVVNSWGWRGAEPTIARSKSVRRAMLLGDSVAFSCWGCREEASLGGILKRALELRTGEEWEVINASVPAGFSSISLGTLAHDGMQFLPDVVTTLNGINDVLVLDERTMLRMGVGLFKHSIYHTTQLDMDRIFDARTGVVQRPGLLDQVASKSALFEVVSKSPLITGLRAHASAKGPPVAPPPTSSGYSTSDPERLDTYVNNQLAMSYLAEGSGAKFVGFLSPYLSLRHKVLGDGDRAAIKAQDHALLTWLDDVHPILRAKLQKAAADHASFNYVDLSLMFTDEQVFADLAHVKYESLEKSLGYDMVAARMAEEIVRALYAGKSLPNWRETHVKGAPHDWNEQTYLAANPDVSALIAEGKFPNGFEHYRSVGFLEFRHSGFPRWDEEAYLAANPDLVPLIRERVFASGYEHYVKHGKAEGRRSGLPMRWIEETYLAANPDVAAAVAAGEFKNGEDHFMKIGAVENRRGGFSGWDEEGYLVPYGDVRNAVIGKMFRSGCEHYLRAGAMEKRQIALGLTSFY
ncbi:hypothetical protein [Bradyrhizobium sp. LVM 105]|uniref:hypothetical protein n=1 Tax=Bradyrhizobium sp. LVM 105 TaxID=2341115 RepID=UPI000F801C9C|nr:hypothetical protein [Bradyrhizobium sp. LVM 105]